MPYDRSDAEVLQAQHERTKDEIRKVLLATVVRVHPDRQTVDVKTAIQNPLADEYGNLTFEDTISYFDVPLGVMRGGGMFIWLPVVPGDSVMLVWSDLSYDSWRSGSGTAPGWVGKHTTDSPFAIPWCAPDAKMFADPNNDPNKIILGKDGGAAQIRLSTSDIELGVNPVDHAALSSKVDAGFSSVVGALNAFITVYDTHTHPTAAAGPPSPPSAPGVAGSTPPSVASNLVKIKS